jgi:hypothetical protein
LKTAADLAAVLTIHAIDDGQYVLRISDLRWRPLVVAVSKLLSDAKSLIVVTPSDIKVLRVTGVAEVSGSGVPAARVATPQEDAGTNARDPEPELDAEMLEAIKDQEGQSIPMGSSVPPSEAPAVEADSGMRVVRRRKPNGQFAGHAETCGRCRGTGHIRIIEESGGAGEAPCGVCQGSGVIQRYGSRR